MNKGRLIFITGLFGAGKTTLMCSAIDKIENLHYLVSYTTRPQRPGEINSEGEFIFVDKEVYLKIKAQSTKWDETIIQDNFYGINVNEIDKQLEEGKNLVVCVAPDRKIIDQMKGMYCVSPVLIWIDTNLEISNERLKKAGREERINHPMQTKLVMKEIKNISDLTFTPSTNLESDKNNFIQLINVVIKQPRGNGTLEAR